MPHASYKDIDENCISSVAFTNHRTSELTGNNTPQTTAVLRVAPVRRSVREKAEATETETVSETRTLPDGYMRPLIT